MPELPFRLSYRFDRYYGHDEQRSGAGACVIHWNNAGKEHAITWGGYLATPAGSPDNVSVLTGILVCQDPGTVRAGDVAHMTYLARISLDTPAADSKVRSYIVTEAKMRLDSSPQSIQFEYSGSSSHGSVSVEAYP